MNQNALDNALQAAERHGFSVIPLSLSKLPAIKSPHDKGHGCKSECGQLGHGVHDASPDPDTIRAMFALAPHATGYGIACGLPPHHLIGLDLDIKNGKNGVEELKKLSAHHGFKVPRTVVISTPSGGWHAWWTGPADVKVLNRAAHMAPNVDVRGAGGYLVGPGSRGKKGVYSLATKMDEVAVAPVPEGLLRLMTADKERPAGTLLDPGNQFLMASGHRGATGGNALIGLVRFVLDSPEGQRNTRLFWSACRSAEHCQRGQLDPRAVENALVDAATHVGLAAAEARSTVASAFSRSTGAVL